MNEIIESKLEMNEIIESKLEVRVLTRSTRADENGKVREFTVYKLVNQKSGKLEDLHFTKVVKNLPTDNCYIYVDDNQINEVKNSIYPKWWVKKINRIEEKQITRKTDLSNFRVTNYDVPEDNLPF